MTRTTDEIARPVLEEFEGAWRGGVPVFGCCRKTVAAAIDGVDLLETASLDVTARVQALRRAVEAAQPGHLDTHRCCRGHVADLAFDLPELIASTSSDEQVAQV